MNKLIPFALAALLALPAIARDDHRLYSVKEALGTPEAKEKLDKGVRLFFGKQPHPTVAKTFGEWKTNKKTNGFTKSDKKACEWTFLSAILELQERARKEGGDAVIDIKSNYKNREYASNDQYMCGSGALMSGVALKGTVVKLAH